VIHVANNVHTNISMKSYLDTASRANEWCLFEQALREEEYLIEVRNLRKTYKPSTTALDGLNLFVRAGSTLALIGENGAGKSTTLKVLSTVCRPDSGVVRVAGIDVLAEPHRIRPLIGYVSQRGGADLECSGRENLLLQGRLHGLSGICLTSRVDELIEKYGLKEVGDRLASTYSGGMRRKLDLAIGLFHKPGVVLFDEPTVGLDPASRAALWADISRMKKAGLTILLTTHHMEEAEFLADAIAIVRKGRVVHQASTEEITRGASGDCIEVEVPSSSAAAQIQTAAEKAGLDRIEVNAGLLRGRSQQGAAAVPVVLSALEMIGIQVLSVKIRKPTLQDAYLLHTGAEV
jgi:ABC-2 type transport system ATP-binding protein